jgi:nitrate reductase cytochrome c-type subunit
MLLLIHPHHRRCHSLADCLHTGAPSISPTHVNTKEQHPVRCCSCRA